MKITLILPDDIGEQVSQMPDRDEFVARALAHALERQGGAAPAPRSRWAQVVKRIESRSTGLQGYSEEMKRDREEFRRDFHFRHDEP